MSKLFQNSFVSALFAFGALVCLLTLGKGTYASAAELSNWKKQAISDRIVIAGRQRMLAEGMASKLCFEASGIEQSANRRELYMMWNIFRWYHAGLRQGNPELRLTAETNVDVIRAWRQMDQVWTGLDGLYEDMLDQKPGVPGAFEMTMDLTDTVTDGATNLVATLRAAYAKQLGPRGFGNALLIDLYERQRMLAQKIAKDVCLIGRGDRSPARREDLAQTAEIFSASLGAFQNGLADVGVPPPPSAEISARLAAARTHWQPASAVVVAATTGRTPTPANLAEFSKSMDRFISEMTGAINALTTLTSAPSQ